MASCVEPALQPEIRAAAVRLLSRAGYDVVAPPREQCCGALTHHMGRGSDSRAAARRMIDVWAPDIEAGTLDAIVMTASGCGASVKDYGHLLREDPAYAEKAASVAAIAQDITELLDGHLPLPTGRAPALLVGLHSACSLQHGQSIREQPVRLLIAAGFRVRQPREAHLCCGSAGVYNILQPAIAERLGRRKADNLDDLEANVLATGNIGCAIQIATYAAKPVVHIVELLDWATGGPVPLALTGRAFNPSTQGFA
jgi:glycolate oxidase iron-sulfur subunit